MRASLRYIRNIGFPILLLAFLFVYAMYRGQFISWFLFYSFIPIVLYQLAVVFYPIRWWEVERMLSRYGTTAGSETVVTIIVRRKIPFPLVYVVCEEWLPESLMIVDDERGKFVDFRNPFHRRKQQFNRGIVFPFFKRQFALRYTLDELPRGEHELTHLRMRTGDLFGIVEKVHHVKVKSTLVVYPRLLPMRVPNHFGTLFQGDIGINQGERKQTNVAASVREYEPGDRMAWIHWKQTAKNAEVMTKEFEQERSSDVLVILNAADFKREKAPLFHVLVPFCYSLIDALEKEQVHVSFFAVSEESTFFPEVYVRDDVATLQLFFASLKQSDDTFSDVMERELQIVTPYNPVFIVTMHIDDALMRLVEKMMTNGKNVHVLYVRSQFAEPVGESRLVAEWRKRHLSLTILTEKSFKQQPIEVKV